MNTRTQTFPHVPAIGRRSPAARTAALIAVGVVALAAVAFGAVVSAKALRHQVLAGNAAPAAPGFRST
jgi:hypothetical protein